MFRSSDNTASNNCVERDVFSATPFGLRSKNAPHARRYVLWLNMQRLTEEEVFELIDSLDREIIEFERIRPHNKGEIRRKDSMDSAAFKKMIAESIEEEHQPGGDIELYIPSVSKVLVGHHDGIYWLD